MYHTKSTDKKLVATKSLHYVTEANNQEYSYCSKQEYGYCNKKTQEIIYAIKNKTGQGHETIQ